MGNLFIGFPVPRAKIATMIEEAAPPLDHITNHLPDGTDPIADPGDISNDQLLQWNGTEFVGVDLPEAGAYPSPLSISPFQFHPIDDQHDFLCDEAGLRTRTDLGVNYFFAPVILPHGSTVTKLTVFAYRTDASAPSNLYFYRLSNTAQPGTLANVTINWTSGNSSAFDSSISFEVIDNTNYSYFLRFFTNPNDSISDVILRRVMIDFI